MELFQLHWDDRNKLFLEFKKNNEEKFLGIDARQKKLPGLSFLFFPNYQLRATSYKPPKILDIISSRTSVESWENKQCQKRTRIK